MEKIAVVKWFDNEKGFGVISNDENEIFLHSSASSKNWTIEAGQCVKYESIFDNRKQREKATKCKLIDDITDWETLLLWLNKCKPQKITINSRGISKWGNFYLKKNEVNVDLIRSGVKQIKNNSSHEEIYDQAISFYDNFLNKDFTLDYLEYVEFAFQDDFGNGNSHYISLCCKHFLNNCDDRTRLIFWFGDNDNLKNELLNQTFELELFFNNIDLIRGEELKIIANSDKYSQHTFSIAEKLIESLEKNTIQDIECVIELSSYLNEKDSKKSIDRFTNLLIKKTEEYISLETSKLGEISCQNSLNEYTNLKKIYSKHIKDIDRGILSSLIDEIIVSKSTSDFHIKLWKIGFDVEISFENISKHFYSDKTSFWERSIIFNKLNQSNKITILLDNSEDARKSDKISFFKSIKQVEDADVKNYEALKKSLIQNIDFSLSYSPSLLNDIIQKSDLDSSHIDSIKKKINSNIENIEAYTLIELHVEFNNRNQIISDTELIQLLLNKNLSKEEIISTVNSIKSSKNYLLHKLLSNNVEQLDKFSIERLINNNIQKRDISRELYKALYFDNESISSPSFEFMFNLVLDSNQDDLKIYFIDNHINCNKRSLSFNLFKLAIDTNYVKGQIAIIKNIEFQNENELISFLKINKKSNISLDILAHNIPLREFIRFMKGESNYSLNDYCKQFLKTHAGVCQTLTIKYLFYLIYRKKVSLSQVKDVLNQFEWTEFNVILIRRLIENNNDDLLKELSISFKEHFNIISKLDLTKNKLLEILSIQGILKKCHGRSLYDGWDYFEDDNSRKDYVVSINGLPKINNRDNLDCFCEGRPWKKVKFWDLNSYRELNGLHEVYWCKTMHCTKRNDTPDLKLPFNEWTIIEITFLLNIKVEKLFLSTLNGWANRMNSIINHLSCRNCESILRPKPFSPKSLGYYAVPLFTCINPKCSDNQIIRFTHCLDGKCDSHINNLPLDSRDCKSCNPSDPQHTGLKCKYCGTGCPSCEGSYNKRYVKDTW